MAIIKNNTNEKIEYHKQKLGLSGDVYIVNEHLMESLESHKKLFPESQAQNIYEAQAERIAYEEEQERKRQEEYSEITAHESED